MNDPATPLSRPKLSLRQRTNQLPRSKKIFLLGGIGLILILIILALIYTYWYQNPKKVVADGVVQALNAKSVSYKGTFTAKSTSNVEVQFNGAAAVKGGSVDMKLTLASLDKKYTIDGSGLLNDKGDVYFKIKNIDDLAQNYRKAIPATSQGLFDQIVAKINDKWIKISSEDLKSYSADVATTQKCMTEAFKKMQNDETVRSEVVAIYKRYPFIVIDKTLGSKDGSLGYLLNIDQNKAQSFMVAFRGTALYKSLHACDKSLVLDIGDSKSGTTMNQNGIFEVWIDSWTHHITKVVVADKSKTTNLTVSPSFNKPVSVTTPSKSTTLEQLQKDVQELLISASVTPAQ
jgi:hypothetical protein